MSLVHVVVQGVGKTNAHRELSKADGRGVERHCEGGSSTKAREGISGQSSREENKANEVEPGGRSDGCGNNEIEQPQQQRGTSITFTQQWRCSENRQLRRGQWMDNKRKADGEHPEDPEREDGKWMRTEGNKRKTIQEEGVSKLRKTVKYSKTSERTVAKKEPEETLEVVELAEVEVNEEEG